MENEVTNSVRTLDRVFVAIKSGKKPGVLASDKFAGLVRPEHALKNGSYAIRLPRRAPKHGDTGK